MKPKILTAIFVSNKGTIMEKWYKYRNISNNPASVSRFLRFAISKGAQEVNFYDKKTALFYEKITLRGR